MVNEWLTYLVENTKNEELSVLISEYFDNLDVHEQLSKIQNISVFVNQKTNLLNFFDYKKEKIISGILD